MKEDNLLQSSFPRIEKKAYSKPTIQKIPLIPEEAVLALCKNNSGVKTLCDPTPNCSPFNKTS